MEEKAVCMCGGTDFELQRTGDNVLVRCPRCNAPVHAFVVSAEMPGELKFVTMDAPEGKSNG